MGTLQPPGEMAKLLCMLACAGAVAAAPTSGFGSEEALISKVMSSLGPSINSAIAAAMGGSRATPITTFQGSVTSGPATSVSFSGSSKGVNSASKWTSSSSSSSKESSFSSSTIGGTGFTGSALGSSAFGSSSLLGSSGLSGFGISSPSFGSSSLSQGQVIESVLSALGPSITSAVEAAAAEQGSKTTTSKFQGSSSSFQGSNQN